MAGENFIPLQKCPLDQQRISPKKVCLILFKFARYRIFENPWFIWRYRKYQLRIGFSGLPDLTLIEQDSNLMIFIKKNIELLHFENFKTYKMDVFRYINQCTESFDFIFAGPPYALKNIDEIPILIFEKKLLNPKGWFVLEHTPRNNYEQSPFFKRSKNYGTTIFSFFVNE